MVKYFPLLLKREVFCPNLQVQYQKFKNHFVLAWKDLKKSEETRLRRLIANLRFNQDFEKSYYERQLSLCVYLLKLWSKRSKKASKALKRCLRRPGSSTGNRSSTSDSSDSSDSDSLDSETDSSDSDTDSDSN